MIEFEDENDLESILEGRPWFFRKQVVIFYRIFDPIERARVRLVETPIWLKVGPCSPGCDKKNLAFAIGTTFGRIMISEFKGYFCHLQV